ncbi:MAG: type I-B CRISPR-associated endonuclease Cas1b [Bacteroidetes bacterium]|nr:type I-B CRISPR-associated endonuclease Cas1b [Bacteroidota bacterium]
MKRNYYIFSSGKLRRKDNTIFFEPYSKSEETAELDEDVLIDTEDASEENSSEDIRKIRKAIPIEDINSFYCFGEHRFNSKFFVFLSQHGIPLHLFNYYGYYSGSYYPKESLVSGKLLVTQVQSYLQSEKRLTIAREIIDCSVSNMLKNLQYYNQRERDMSPFIEMIKELQPKIKSAEDIKILMGIEGSIRKVYYESWHLIITDEIDFEKRERRPPPNPVNALISFGNGLLYARTLSEIYQSQLNPTISFLHEPGERRFSLSLDIAEIFKPLLVDRTIFSLLNKKVIQEKHFDKNLNMCYLSNEGRKLFTQEFDEKLKTTIQHRTLKRSVSYQSLIRLECYKIIKHILNDKQYNGFKIWW